MLKEALHYLHEIGKASANVVLKPDAEPPHVYYLRRPDGTLEKVTAEPKPASDAAFDLDAVVAVAKRFVEHAEVWYGPGHVVCVYGDGLRDRATLTLDFGEQYLKLLEWKKNGSAMTQAELVRQLRTTFRGSLALVGDLAESIRRVNFKATSNIDAEVGHGKASLGKQIASEVTGTKQIPEYVRFQFPVYANPSLKGFRAEVECAIEPDASTGVFRVIPLPGQLEQAVEMAGHAINTRLIDELAEDDVPVYHGTPG